MDVSPEMEALGKLGDAMEKVERARGHLYSMHQLIGSADFELDEVVDLLRKAGHDDLASRIDRQLLGRNVLPGRWTYQIVEEFDDGYYALFSDFEREARHRIAGGRRHAYEALLKEHRRTPGEPGHDADPTRTGEG